MSFLKLYFTLQSYLTGVNHSNECAECNFVKIDAVLAEKKCWGHENDETEHLKWNNP